MRNVNKRIEIKMESKPRVMHTLLFLLFLLNLYPTFATDKIQKIKCDVYQAFVHGNQAKWIEATKALKRAYNWERDPKISREVVIAQYGLIGYMIGEGNKKEAKKIYHQALGSLEELLEKQPKDAELLALKGAFLAFRISFNKINALTLGPKSKKYINKALEVNNKAPLALIQKGNAKNYMPKSFGGDTQEAIHYYKKAVEVFEEKGGGTCNWLYLSTLAYLGKMYMEIGQEQAAIKTFRKALNIAPEFKWVKDELLPMVR